MLLDAPPRRQTIAFCGCETTTFSAASGRGNDRPKMGYSPCGSVFSLDLGQYCEGAFGFAVLAPGGAGSHPFQGRIGLARERMDGASQAFVDNASDPDLAGHDRL